MMKFNLPKSMMVHFNTTIIESILTPSIPDGYGGGEDAAAARDKSRLQRIIRCAEEVIG